MAGVEAEDDGPAARRRGADDRQVEAVPAAQDLTELVRRTARGAVVRDDLSAFVEREVPCGTTRRDRSRHDAQAVIRKTLGAFCRCRRPQQQNRYGACAAAHAAASSLPAADLGASINPPDLLVEAHLASNRHTATEQRQASVALPCSRAIAISSVVTCGAKRNLPTSMPRSSAKRIAATWTGTISTIGASISEQGGVSIHAELAHSSTFGPMTRTLPPNRLMSLASPTFNSRVRPLGANTSALKRRSTTSIGP